MRGALALVLSAAALALAAMGCESVPATADCGALADKNACPLSGGGTCADPSCSAIYACRGGAWALVTRCMNDLDAGPSADAAPEASTCATVMLPPATDTCPALQAPDCDATLVDQCPASACSTGCTGFLRCTPGGWSVGYVAYCDEGGTLVVSGK